MELSASVAGSGPRPHSIPAAGGRSRFRWGAFFMVILDGAIVIVALPSIEADLGFSASALQWVISAYAVALAGLLLAGIGLIVVLVLLGPRQRAPDEQLEPAPATGAPE